VKPIFTVHAGEYLVGSYVEQNFKDINVWVPSKDVGVDLLLTNKKNNKTASVQVKFSKDFLTTHFAKFFQKKLKSCGWWKLNSKKLKYSPADFWIFVLYSHNQKDIQNIIIKPKELLRKLQQVHGNMKIIQTYLQVTIKNKCWETRGLNKKEQTLIALGEYSGDKRDFTKYLNNWEPIKKQLR